MAASTAAAEAGAPAPAAPAALTFKPVALPGATAPASLDYIAYEPGKARVWVPVGNTGSVDVYDTAAASFTRVDGFKTAEREYKGKKRTAGPSAVTIGDGFAYVGNRATSEICPVDLGTLKPGKCVKLPSSTDGVAYVASAKEVWVTTPRTQTIAVLDASKPGVLKAKTSIKLEGDPEGYAVDASRGLFFTNLEDKNKTVVIDIVAHKVKATWTPDCGNDGPRGIAAEVAHGFVFVACTDHVDVLDGSHDGAQLGKVDTGPGVDNIDWIESSRRLYAAAGRAAKATVAQIDDKGAATVVASGASTDGARNGVADAAGNFYVADPVNARLLVFPAAQ
jgi:DNA-binding beta-propeller fold protein YncE